MSALPVIVIGGGLAGTEAAYQIARHGLPVQLYEMRPQRQTLAHQTDLLGELVCSNSLKADTLSSAHGLLKAELRQLGSLVLQAADASRVPAGAALAVDRIQFAEYLTATISRHPNITLRREEVVELPAGQTTIVATGPLTSPSLTAHIQHRLGSQYLYFYDALSPIVAADSIDQSKTFFASRYDIGDGDDYLNCPLDRDTYEQFCAALVAAECVKPHAFEQEIFFEGCLPIEEMARRGPQTLAFGPLKPVGLRRVDRPAPYAVVQLRLEDTMRSAYNMVGFQTRLTYAEQRRVFRMIPGLEQAEFLRLGASPPQYLPQCAAAAPAYLTDQTGIEPVVCRADYGGRGLCGIGCHRTSGRAQCRSAAPWHTAPGAPADYSAWCAGALYRLGQARDVSTDEHPFRFAAASRYTHAPEKGAARRDDCPGAGRPAGVARLGGRMMDAYLDAFQTYLEVERQASPHTLRNYLSDLHQFVRFASGRLEHRSRIAPSPLVGEGRDGGAAGEGKEGLLDNLRQQAALTPARIDAALIRDFLSTLYQQGVGHTTLARKLASLRSFLHFLQRRGYIQRECGQACAVSESAATITQCAAHRPGIRPPRHARHPSDTPVAARSGYPGIAVCHGNTCE